MKAVHSHESRNQKMIEKVADFYDSRGGAKTGYLSSEGLEGSEDLLF